jgi:hypothetical protein
MNQRNINVKAGKKVKNGKEAQGEARGGSKCRKEAGG